jgi:small-conductance mechanosensitive channel
MNYFFIRIKTDENKLLTIPNFHFSEKSFSGCGTNEKRK